MCVCVCVCESRRVSQVLPVRTVHLGDTAPPVAQVRSDPAVTCWFSVTPGPTVFVLCASQSAPVSTASVGPGQQVMVSAPVSLDTKVPPVTKVSPAAVTFTVAGTAALMLW